MTNAVRSAPADTIPLPARDIPKTRANAAPKQKSADAGRDSAIADACDRRDASTAGKSEQTSGPSEQVRSAARKHDDQDDDSSQRDSKDTFASAVEEANRVTTSDPSTANQSQTVTLAAMLAGASAAQPPGDGERQSGIDAASVFSRQRRSNIALNLVKLNQADAESTQVPLDAVSADGEIKTAIKVQSRETHWFMGEKLPSTPRAENLPAGSVAASAQLIGSSPSSSIKPASDSLSPAAKDVVAEVRSQVAAVQPANLQDAGTQSGSTPNERENSGTRSSSAEAAKALSKSAGVEADTTQTTEPLTPAVQQVKQSVLDALSNDGKATSTPASRAAAPEKPATPGHVLRSIEVTLSPADLGSVKLKLSLKDNALAIDAEATKATTASLLKDGRGVLEQNLREAGYDVAAVRISDVSAGPSASFNGNASTGGSANSRSGEWQQQAQSSGGGDDGQRSSGSGSEQQRRFRQTQEQSGTRSSDRPQPKGVYI